MPVIDEPCAVIVATGRSRTFSGGTSGNLGRFRCRGVPCEVSDGLEVDDRELVSSGMVESGAPNSVPGKSEGGMSALGEGGLLAESGAGIAAKWWLGSLSGMERGV